MDPLAIITVIFGAVLALLGILVFLKKGTQGTNRIKMLGFEFELAGSALVIFVVGAMLIVVPWIYSGRQKNDPSNPGVDSESGTSTPSGVTGPTNPTDPSRDPGPNKTVTGVEVPSVQFKSLTTAVSELAKSGLKFEIRREESQQPSETVLKQEPPGGQVVEPNSLVILTIPDSVITVPDVKGQPLTQAIFVLAQKGLKIGPQKSQIDGAGGVGTILDQVPKANDKVAVGTEVQLTIKGESVTVPRVTEIAWDIARNNIASAGLKVAAQWDESSSKPSGIVILQQPLQGAQVSPGSEVVLTVAGKTPSINPNLVRVLTSIKVLPDPATKLTNMRGRSATR